MPITKKLHDVVELLGEHDVIYQDMAVKDLVRILDMAEQDIADSHLTVRERMAAQRERGLATLERLGGKERADAIRERMAAIDAAIDRGDLDALDE
jgi:hypothetical protein